MAKTPYQIPSLTVNFPAPPTQSSDHSLHQASSWHCHERRQKCDWGLEGGGSWRISTSIRCSPRWMGGVWFAERRSPTGRPLCVSSGHPHPPSHVSPVSYSTCTSPAGMRAWPDSEDEAPLGSLPVCWCSELLAGSVFGGSNQLNPECCPLLTRRSPSQQQAFHRGPVPTAVAFHPWELYTEESWPCLLPCRKTQSPRG